MTISIDGDVIGELEIGLFGEITPKTVENFRALCIGKQNENDAQQKLSYNGSKFHRIIPGFLIQGI